MAKTYKLSLSIILLASMNCFGQISLPVPVNLQAAYNNGTRTINGTPGKNYWQNSADYTIKINFDPKTRNLNGTVAIDYYNNGPDTLKQIIFKLYPNLYKKGVIRDMPISPEDVTDGLEIQRLSINQQNQNASQWQTEGTDMNVKVPPIAPNQKMQFEITYSYTLNKTSHIRTGQVDSGAFFIAYFFPHIAVYDDIDGWNQHHYKGVQEFYNDFGHFNAEITVPGDYEVWATGNLKNANEVYNDKFVKRLADAVESDKISDIITEADLKVGNITVNKATNTWKFEADSVTDMAFAISNHYIWKSTSLVVDAKTGRRTRVDAVFNPDHNSDFEVINYARKTVETMSYKFPNWPYPY